MSEQTREIGRIICFTCICECYENYLKDEWYWYRRNRYDSRKSEWELKLSEAYQFKSTKAFLKHHDSKHELNGYPIRLICTKCLQTFSEPGLAKKHGEKIVFESKCENDEQAKFKCSQCTNKSFVGMTAFLEHASNKHGAHYDEYKRSFNYWDAQKLKAPSLWKPENCLFWSWTGRNFSPICGRVHPSMNLTISPGCNYVPNWPYTVIYGCGLCSFVNDHKVRVRNHLKSKHSVLTPDAPMPRKKRYLSSSSEERSNDGKESTLSDDLSFELDELCLKEKEEAPRIARRFRGGNRGARLYYCSKMYRCKKCARVFDSTHAAFQHDDKSHPFNTSEEVFPYHVDDFCCSYCSSQFELVSATKEHEEKVHPQYAKQNEIAH